MVFKPIRRPEVLSQTDESLWTISLLERNETSGGEELISSPFQQGPRVHLPADTRGVSGAVISNFLLHHFPQEQNIQEEWGEILSSPQSVISSYSLNSVRDLHGL